MASAKYQRLPSSPSLNPAYEPESDEEVSETGGHSEQVRELHRMLHADPRFNPPPPATWKRVALLILVIVLFWLGFTMRRALMTPHEVVYADR